MILALLKDLKKKHIKFEWRPNREDTIMNLGKAFTLFLQLYGDQFKSSDYGINSKFEFKDFYDCTLELEKAQHAQSANLDDQNPALMIIDPIQPMNNVGKQSFDFEKVSNFFNLTLLRMLLRFRELSDMHLVTHDNSSDLN
jgi:DNA polymerase sigma